MPVFVAEIKRALFRAAQAFRKPPTNTTRAGSATALGVSLPTSPLAGPKVSSIETSRLAATKAKGRPAGQTKLWAGELMRSV